MYQHVYTPSSGAQRGKGCAVRHATKNSIKLQNTDPRWYRDKYLTGIFIFCFIGGMSYLWAWPPPHENLIHGLRFPGVAAICLALTPQRLLVLAAGLLFIFTRGLIGGILHRSVGVLIIGLVAGLIVYVLFVQKKLNLTRNYQLKEYSYAELIIDMAVFLPLLWLGVKAS